MAAEFCSGLTVAGMPPLSKRCLEEISNTKFTFR